jgi:hypothetical protein
MKEVTAEPYPKVDGNTVEANPWTRFRLSDITG